MLFNSHSFILFFLGVLLIHHCPLPWRAKKFNLLVASNLFYAAWNPPFIFLLWYSIVLDWFVGRALANSTSHKVRRALLAATLVSNLGLLAAFKYGGFILENLSLLLGWAGIGYPSWKLEILLPVGISFYTFQSLSYTIDIYRGEIKPCRSFLGFALFVSFFPQLEAGPIVRAREFLPQLDSPRVANREDLAIGVLLFILGLFMKVVVADAIMAPVAEKVFDSLTRPEGLICWSGVLAFTIQIYCDFGGYSACAIGLARCLGFRLPRNFWFPYGAVGFSDFWRRWHISLSSWLRDYVYIPLGGNLDGTVALGRNIMLTMLIGGLWHGAAWHFVVWGALHGILLLLERLLRATVIPILDLPKSVNEALGWVLTFAGLLVTWIYFRADSAARAAIILKGLVHPMQATERVEGSMLLPLVISPLIVIGQFAVRNTTLAGIAGRCPAWLLVSLVSGMLVSLVVLSGNSRAFIYFQF